MSDHITHQATGDKLAEDAKHNLGGPGPDQGAGKKASSSNAQSEADHGKDQTTKVGRAQYQDLKDDTKQK
ncbi:hypothetical protein TruAng_009214 [Truncatella angustata]|nr:hypothetical protein TruAng_009214 [Truncatella angustata]